MPAWIETSRADTGSSRTISSGSSARARAMPMRCRWPPENSVRVAGSRARATGRRCVSSSGDLGAASVARLDAAVHPQRLGDDRRRPSCAG